MQFKIENKLTTSDIEKLIYILEDELIESIELLPEFEYEPIGVSSLVISHQNGYSLRMNMDFCDPIGGKVCSIMGIKEHGLKKSASTIEMDIKQQKIDSKKLADDINYSLSLIEKIVNYACTIRRESIYETVVVNFEHISRQVKKRKAEKERITRGEEIRAFELVHADSGRDLNTLPNDLIPFYEEYDHWDLYGGKKVYRLLTKEFVLKLLKCQNDIMISEKEFNEHEKKVLENLVKRCQIKRRRITGSIYYFKLDDRTRRYLNKHLRKREFKTH